MPFANLLRSYHTSIRHKLNFTSVSFGLLLLICTAVPLYYGGRRILEADSIARLQAVSAQKRLTLEGWRSYTLSIIEGIVNAPNLQADLRNVYSAPAGTLARQQAAEWLAHDLRTWTQSIRTFAALTVIDLESGDILASTRAEEMGKNVLAEAYFQNAKDGVFIEDPFISRLLKEPIIRVSLPFHTLDGGGKAVLAVRIRLDKIDDIMQRGISAELRNNVYVVNSQTQVIVKPRAFPQAVVLQDTITSPAVQRCITGESGAIVTKNYQGVAVISSFTWLPDQQLCLLVEEEQDAAFAGIQRFNGALLLAASLTFIVAHLLGYRLSRSIITPLQSLLSHVNRFDAEELDNPVTVTSQDEFGRLADAFNQMAARLSRSLTETRRVAEENMELYYDAQQRRNELQEERNFLDKLLNTSTSLILGIDRDGRIVKHNQAVENLTGFTSEQMHGKLYTDLLDTPRGKFENVPAKDVFFGGKFPDQLEERFVMRDGKVQHINWNVDAIFDSRGQVEYVIAIGMDMTAIMQAEEKLRQSEQNIRIALATAPISIYTTDKDCRVTFIRHPYPGIPEEQIIGKRIDAFLPPPMGEALLAIQYAVMESGEAQSEQFTALINDMPVHYVYYADPVFDSTGAVTGMACAGYDITDLKKSEQALLEIKENLERLVEERTRELHQSHAILQTMLDALPETATLVDRQGTIIVGNQALADRFDMDLESLPGKVVYSFFPPDVAARRKSHIDQVFLTAKPLRYTDMRAGRYYDNMLYPVINEAGIVMSVAVLAVDVTEWKRTEEAIRAGRERLKALTRKVVVAQEEERHRISRELHDEAGQAMTALSIGLKLLHADIPEQLAAEKHRLADAIDLVSTTMERIRLLAQDLRPQALDALGLNETLGGYCREFARRTNLQITYQGAEAGPLSDIAGVSLYRVLQEALNNAAKHSGGSHVNVMLQLKGSILTLSVRDDGQGFDLSEFAKNDGPARLKNLGLVGMRERIEMLGGVMQVHSIPGQGTSITAAINVTGEFIEKRGNYDQSRNR